MEFNVVNFLLKEGVLTEYLKYYNHVEVMEAIKNKKHRLIINNFHWCISGPTEWGRLYHKLDLEVLTIKQLHGKVVLTFKLPYLTKQIKGTDEN